MKPNRKYKGVKQAAAVQGEVRALPQKDAPELQAQKQMQANGPGL